MVDLNMYGDILNSPLAYGKVSYRFIAGDSYEDLKMFIWGYPHKSWSIETCEQELALAILRHFGSILSQYP